MKENRFMTIRLVFLLGIGVAVALAGCGPSVATPTPTMTPAIASVTEIAPAATPTAPKWATPGVGATPTAFPVTILPVPTILVETGKGSGACPRPIPVSPTIQDNAGWHHYGATSIQKLNIRALSAAGEWLWIATEQEVIRLNQRTLEYELFSHTHTIPDITLDKVYTLAVDDQGRLWAGGAHGLVRYDNKGWRVIYTDEEVSNFALDNDGNLWRFTFYTRTAPQAYRFQGQEPPTRGHWTPELMTWPSSFWEKSNWRLLALYGESTHMGPIKDVNGDIWSYDHDWFDGFSVYCNGRAVQSIPVLTGNVNAIAANTIQGGIWIGMKTGLFYSNKQSLTRYQFTGKIATDDPLVFALVFADNGSGWAATSEGLLHYNKETNAWENVVEVNTKIPFRGNDLITLDQRDGLWILGDDHLAHFDSKQLERWPIPPEISRSGGRSYAIVQFQDYLWVAAGDRGLWRFDGQAWSKVLPLTILSLTQEHNEKLYIRENQGSIIVYDGTDWRRLPDCVACEQLFLGSDTDHRIWGANTSSIWRYSADEGWCNILALPDVSDQTSIRVDVDTHGGLWVANCLGGILHCAQEHCELWKWEQDTGCVITTWEYCEYSFPLRPLITAMAIDPQGRLWVGGWGMLSVYDPATVP